MKKKFKVEIKEEDKLNRPENEISLEDYLKSKELPKEDEEKNKENEYIKKKKLNGNYPFLELCLNESNIIGSFTTLTLAYPQLNFINIYFVCVWFCYNFSILLNFMILFCWFF